MTLGPNKKPFRLSLGQRGEMIAWNYLIGEGYKIIEKNYRCKIGEIDIIAQKQKRIHFVEVKTRTSEQYGLPEESVHPVKQKKIVRIAEWYLKEKHINDAALAFSVIAILLPEHEAPNIRFIERAFEVADS